MDADGHDDADDGPLRRSDVLMLWVDRFERPARPPLGQCDAEGEAFLKQHAGQLANHADPLRHRNESPGDIFPSTGLVQARQRLERHGRTL